MNKLADILLKLVVDQYQLIIEGKISKKLRKRYKKDLNK